jgi:hypothetical protein
MEDLVAHAPRDARFEHMSVERHDTGDSAH